MNEVLLMEEKKEKALLVGLNITSTARKIDDIDINESMEELKELEPYKFLLENILKEKTIMTKSPIPVRSWNRSCLRPTAVSCIRSRLCRLCATLAATRWDEATWFVVR